MSDHRYQMIEIIGSQPHGRLPAVSLHSIPSLAPLALELSSTSRILWLLVYEPLGFSFDPSTLLTFTSYRRSRPSSNVSSGQSPGTTCVFWSWLDGQQSL
ncbi:hypothetical protein LXA43DRAFT_1105732 [Ganoderma leucocontextum]|nr:hypothetical protein LXA43DRAFT_1105732 [Ganoderma leucocontextum]